MDIHSAANLTLATSTHRHRLGIHLLDRTLITRQFQDASTQGEGGRQVARRWGSQHPAVEEAPSAGLEAGSFPGLAL
jgi:hypothetical protein